MIRAVVIVLAVMLLSSGSAAAQTAQRAPEVPQGSYLRSCRDARVEGDVLYARCYQEDVGWRRAILRDFDNCTGDIRNDNGVLRCSQPAYRAPQHGQDEGYDHRQRCERLQDRRRDIREQLQQTPSWDQDRQERLRQRLDEVHDRYRDEGCLRLERRERCERLRGSWQELYQRIQHTPSWNLFEKERLRERLNGVRGEYRRAGCGQR